MLTQSLNIQFEGLLIQSFDLKFQIIGLSDCRVSTGVNVNTVVT